MPYVSEVKATKGNTLPVYHGVDYTGKVVGLWKVLGPTVLSVCLGSQLPHKVALPVHLRLRAPMGVQGKPPEGCHEGLQILRWFPARG